MAVLFLILIPVVFILATLTGIWFARGLYKRLIRDGTRGVTARILEIIAFLFVFAAVAAGLFFLMDISHIRFSRM